VIQCLWGSKLVGSGDQMTWPFVGGVSWDHLGERVRSSDSSSVDKVVVAAWWRSSVSRLPVSGVSIECEPRSVDCC